MRGLLIYRIVMLVLTTTALILTTLSISASTALTLGLLATSWCIFTSVLGIVAAKQESERIPPSALAAGDGIGMLLCIGAGITMLMDTLKLPCFDMRPTTPGFAKKAVHEAWSARPAKRDSDASGEDEDCVTPLVATIMTFFAFAPCMFSAIVMMILVERKKKGRRVAFYAI